MSPQQHRRELCLSKNPFTRPLPLEPGLESARAEANYQQALAVELGMRPLQAHCHHALGTLYAATGQAEQARVELSTAMEMYRAMEMTFWLPETEAALAQVEEQ